MRAALALLLALALPAPAIAAPLLRAELVQPTARYDHGVLGDALEWGGLRLHTATGSRTFTLPASRVFEDVAARLGDFDGDGTAEVMVVETDIARGATLAIYDLNGKRTATAPVGQTHRWLAPAGWGDFDGDGRPEIAYVDRPHLARELVFLRLTGSRLTEIARFRGVTNHRIGDAVISGGIRICDQGAEVIVANADWSRVIAVRLDAATPVARDLGALRGPRSFARAQSCRN